MTDLSNDALIFWMAHFLFGPKGRLSFGPRPTHRDPKGDGNKHRLSRRS